MSCRKPVGVVTWGKESKRLATPQGVSLNVDTAPSLSKALPNMCAHVSPALQKGAARMES